MAKSLETRINAALRSAARLTDIEGVIADVEAEIAATQVNLDRETARSVDPALTTPEAREARNNAADLEHDIRRLHASLGMLKEKRQKLVDDDAEAQRRKAYDEAKAERDDLACHIRSRYPEIAMELQALVYRIQASDRQCEAVSRDRPEGAPVLVAAEYLARECGHYWNGVTSVTRLAEIKLPLLGRSGRYLPIESRTTDQLDMHWRASVKADLEFANRPVPGVTSRLEAAAEPA